MRFLDFPKSSFKTRQQNPGSLLPHRIFNPPVAGVVTPVFMSMSSTAGLHCPISKQFIPPTLWLHKPRTRLLQWTVEEKVFIVDMRESTARGIWKSPEQGEKEVDQV